MWTTISAILALLVGAFLGLLWVFPPAADSNRAVIGILAIVLMGDGLLATAKIATASLPVAWLFFLGIVGREAFLVYMSYCCAGDWNASLQSALLVSFSLALGMLGLLLSVVGEFRSRRQPVI